MEMLEGGQGDQLNLTRSTIVPTNNELPFDLISEVFVCSLASLAMSLLTQAVSSPSSELCQEDR